MNTHKCVLAGELQNLTTREQFYMDKVSKEMGYNIFPTVGTALGFKHSYATRKKMSATHLGKTISDKTREKISESRSGENHYLFGKTHSLETREKMSAAKSGVNYPLFGKTHSPETRYKMMEAKQNMSKETRQKMSEAQGTTIYLYNRYLVLMETFSSARLAAKYLSCSNTTIMKYARNGEIFKKEYRLSLEVIKSP
jgi:group I intron endonuclease